MPSSFNFDSGALERAARDAANDGLLRLAEQYQRLLDELHASHAGRPVEEIKTRLAREWPQVNDSELTEPALSQYAQAIADGQRIVITPEQI